MFIMKTKITAILLTIAVIFSFAACGKTDTVTTTAAATTVQTNGTTAAETATQPEEITSQTDARTGAETTAATTKAATQATTTAPAVKSFTKAELAKYDGKSGRDAYIAYDGIVYDVTDINLWNSGVHQGLKVGTDLTAQVNSCSHHLITFMKAQFSTYPKVGTYTG
jgi:predicted heme/steroid binding protein